MDPVSYLQWYFWCNKCAIGNGFNVVFIFFCLIYDNCHDEICDKKKNKMGKMFYESIFWKL